VAADTTYVIYMPGNRYAELGAELQAAGIGAEIPCVVISRATTKDETIFRTTVGQLPECPPAASPSLLVVGIVARIATGMNSQDKDFSIKLSEEVLQLALQHPYHDLHGRGGVK
jgi:siroheme synthase